MADKSTKSDPMEEELKMQVTKSPTVKRDTDAAGIVANPTTMDIELVLQQSPLNLALIRKMSYGPGCGNNFAISKEQIAMLSSQSATEARTYCKITLPIKAFVGLMYPCTTILRHTEDWQEDEEDSSEEIWEMPAAPFQEQLEVGTESVEESSDEDESPHKRARQC